MKWIKSGGKIVNINISKNLIDWDASAASMEAQVVQDFLKKYCQTHVILTEFRIPNTRLRIDYINLTLRFAWEHHGNQHFVMNKWMHGSELGFLASIKRDDKKRQMIELNNLVFIESEKKDFPLTKQWVESNFGIYL